jgi:hypothetical protein
MDVNELFAGIAKTFELVGREPSTVTLSVVGLILLFLAGALAYLAITKPEKMLRPLPAIFFTSLIGGMIFSAAGPGLALFWVSQNPIKKISTDKLFDNLEKNRRVSWVIRLISFEQKTEPELGIDRLSQLGPPKQLFSFVGSYDELVGYNVKDALEATGVRYVNGDRVSAIIFPLGTPLFPANARGLLQVIQKVQARKDVEIKEKFFQGNNSLSSDEIKDLDERNNNLESYQFESFQDKYQRYCQLSYHFMCDKPAYSALELIGSLDRDWHPLGFSQKVRPHVDSCDVPIASYCAFSDWKTMKSDFYNKLGARTFLIRNLEIDRIPGRILIDFENPEKQVIPDIGQR